MQDSFGQRKKKTTSQNLLSHICVEFSTKGLGLACIGQTGQTADFAAGTFGRNDTFAGGLIQDGDGLIEAVIQAFCIFGCCHAEITDSMF